ncbi:hypothetical protein EHQ61_16295 [Leptospira wolffii]|uniref:plasmid replication protein, CyRepA1 family n=1 Tax=Leptospira wolffii TaxID=409998 RepID=UPI00108307AB|nr:plasmid replication protein, CyRepA1 family [Leptospira wolffii]TGL46864.1 hypothetical protein EHQ61_16295 [Leptospira wolffii]
MSEIHFKIAVNKDNRLKNKYKEYCRENKIAYPTNFMLTEFSLAELRDHVSQGLSFACGYYQGDYRHGKNFLGSNLLVLDIDKGMNLREALESPLISENAALIYTSPSHTDTNHKFRIVFVTPRELERDEYKTAILNLHGKFLSGSVDSSCTDFARSFYGNTNAEFLLQTSRSIKEELLEELLQPFKEEIAIGSGPMPSASKRDRLGPPKNLPKQIIEYPEEVLERVRHALSFIPNKIKDDNRRNIYLNIVKALQSVYDVATIRDLLSNKIDPASSFNIQEALAEDYQIEIGTIFNLAKEHGWSLDQFFDARDKELQSEKKLPVPSIATEILDNRYLSEYPDWGFIKSKTIVVHSSHGTGKTAWAMNQLREELFIYVTHREELAKDIWLRLGNSGIDCHFYKDFDGNDYRVVSQSVVICIDSLWKLNVDNFQNHYLIVDEFDQFVNHIHGVTCKENRIGIHDNLLKIVRNAKQNFFLSSDFPEVSINFIRRVLHQVDFEYLFNRYIPNIGRELFIHRTEESILRHAFQRLREGHKISIASFSKRKALQYEKRFKAEFSDQKDLKVICIVRDTKDMEEQKALLQDKALIKEYSVVIFSPVLSSGVDFNYEYSDYNYLIANSWHTSDHYEGIQMSNRMRNYKELHLFCISSKGIDHANTFRSVKSYIFPSLLAAYRKFYRNHHLTVKLRASKINISNKYKKEWRAFILNSFQVKRYKAFLFLDLFPNLINGFLYRGYKVQYYSPPIGEEVVIDLSHESSVKEKIGNQIEEELERVFFAADITEIQYLQILKGGAWTENQNYSLKKYQYQRLVGYIPGNVESENDLKETIYSRKSIDSLKRKMDHFKLLTFGESYARKKDDSQFKDRMFQDFEFNEVKYNLLRDIYSLIPKEDWFTGKNIPDLLDYVNQHKATISNNLFEITEAHLKFPIRFVSSFLKFLDLNLETKQKGKDKHQIYKIDKRKLSILNKRCSRMVIGFESQEQELLEVPINS